MRLLLSAAVASSMLTLYAPPAVSADNVPPPGFVALFNGKDLDDWKILAKGDSGIYLRGSPQVQIWDPAQHPEGSAGLFNNKQNPSKPSKCADNPVEQWNSFRIKMVGDKVSVWLNGELVVDNVVLENYWDRDKPIYPTGQLELQHHGNTLWFKNVYIREIPGN